MNSTVQIVGMIAFFALIFGIEYLRITARHRKEMAMIEAGMNPTKKKISVIKLAFLLLFIPSGLFIGNYYADKYGFENSDITGVMLALVFGGIALLLANFIENKIKNKDSKN